MTIYLSENIKRLRREKNLTQEALAEFLGVTFQTVSNWERSESYPDITMLPEIAGFFKVSVDELLGISRAEDEEEIKRLLNEHDNLTDDKLIYQSIMSLKEKFPGDFRVQLRYMSNLIFFNNAIENKGKIISLYQNIQEKCTSDSVRICAKRFYIHFLELLSREENSGVTFEDCEKIIKEMPRMRDGQEMFFNCYPKNHPERTEIIREAIEEELCLLDNTLSHYLWDGGFSDKQKIKAYEKAIDILDFLYDDGNYGRMWRIMMYNYGHRGVWYFQIGDGKKALESFRKMCELAVKFDSMDRITVMHSLIFDGKEFDKQTLGTTYIAKMQIKELLTEKYPLSEEFRESEEFKEMIEGLGA